MPLYFSILFPSPSPLSPSSVSLLPLPVLLAQRCVFSLPPTMKSCLFLALPRSLCSFHLPNLLRIFASSHLRIFFFPPTQKNCLLITNPTSSLSPPPLRSFVSLPPSYSSRSPSSICFPSYLHKKTLAFHLTQPLSSSFYCTTSHVFLFLLSLLQRYGVSLVCPEELSLST